MTDAFGYVRRHEHDDVGNRTATIDELGRRTTYGYDALNRLASVTLPSVGAPAVTHMTYDEVGNLRTLTDALGRVTEYEYDAANRRILEIDAKGGQWRTVYDLAGNVIATVDAVGRRTEFDYDELNRLVETRKPHPVTAGVSDTTTTRTYDAAGNLLTSSDALGRVTNYTYDKLNRLETMTDPANGVSRVEYDEVGNRKATIDELGRRTDYTYDALNRLLSVTAPAGSRPRWARPPGHHLRVRRRRQPDENHGCARVQHDVHL